ncbi:hypothetical protein [Sporolactobacillus inulinus]|uniref:hypothetical protein n=1 Tax=Sporolactobacillus inulinus TaxID=2078 RepID=UPI0011423B70|nr:hypothetical protein [Sporolactobacillus inulinus]GEB77772.1 hypothetical protein SIN01_21170 [Sporolactobacillus inulinus]
MVDENEKRVYQCLIDELNTGEIRELLIKKNIIIKSFQANRLRNESQWSVMIRLFRNNLGNKKYQKAILEYYVKSIFSNREEGDIELTDKEIKEEKHILDRETLINDSKKIGFYKVLVYLAFQFEYERAVQLIKDVPPDQRFRNKEDMTNQSEQSKLKQLEERNRRLDDENRKLAKEVSKQEEIMKHLELKYEKRIQQLETVQKRKLEKMEEKHHSYQAHVADEKKELKAQQVMIKKQVEELSKRQHELESENNDLKQKIEQQNKLISTPSNQIKEDRKQKVLIFGNIPREVMSDLYDYEIFSKDASSYSFNESFDAYWLIKDMVSRQLNVTLKKNPHIKNIAFRKLTYYQMIDELQGNKEAIK